MSSTPVSITVSISEGRFVYLGARPDGFAHWGFQRRMKDGAFSERLSKSPGRLSWRRKAKRAAEKKAEAANAPR